MDCYYINLDAAPERRARIEANFAEHKAPGWTLTRFPAVDAEEVSPRRISGTLRPAEKARFLSHRDLIGSLNDAARPVMVMEDDALIGRHTCPLIETLLANPRGPDWDILFTNLCFPQLKTKIELAKYRRQVASTGSISLLDLKKFAFAGSSGYIVNPKSLVKLHSFLLAIDTLNTAYDVYLSHLTREFKLRSYVFFPFVTSQSDPAVASRDRADLIGRAFSRMTWVDRDPLALGAMREAVAPSPDKAQLLEALFTEIEAGKEEYP